MTPPIEAKLEVVESTLNSEAIKLTLKGTFKSAEWKAKATLEEAGVIKSAESGRTLLEDWNNLESGESFSIPFTVKASSYGKGSIKVKVEVYDEGGKLKYGVNPTQYFLVRKDGVLSGNNGFMNLELQHLDQLKEQGEISNKEYDKHKEEITDGN